MIFFIIKHKHKANDRVQKRLNLDFKVNTLISHSGIPKQIHFSVN